MKIPPKRLISEYKIRRASIKKRLAQFASVHNKSDKDIFSELCYCLFTANANALMCDAAVRELKARNLVLAGSASRIRPVLRGRVRFHNKKAGFLVAARDIFKKNKRLDLKTKLRPCDNLSTRDWLVDNIKGFGYKEASHFLRNIGLGKNIAILDRHILKNLKNYGVIDKVPPSLTRKAYLEIEERMRRFAKRIRIPIEELDLLLWAIETGFVFK